MKIWTIIKKEYRQIVKKKAFIVSTLLTPILMGGIMFVPLLLSKVGRQEKTIVIEDFSGIVMDAFKERTIKDKTIIEALKLKFTGPDKPTEEQNQLTKEFQGKIENNKPASLALTNAYHSKIMKKDIDGLVIIPENVKDTRKIYFLALNISDFNTNRYISSSIQKILSERILTEQNIEMKIVEDAIRDVTMDPFKVKDTGTEKSSSGIEYIMAIFMMSIMMTVIMAYGQLMMRGVLEEKSNRIVEVLISSTRVQTLFYGKIVGIGLAGLTQVGIWGAFVIGLGFMGKSAAAAMDQSLANIMNFLTPELVVYFIIFFVLGYFMYSIMFAIVGASVNTDQEAQQFAAPITYLLFVPLLICIMATQNPNTTMVLVTSLIPAFTPMVMFTRISIAVPAFWQIGLSIVLSILFIMFLAWLGAKIFRVGILMYGKKPTVKELFRWLRYK